MKIEYDQKRDLLYVWFRAEGTLAARTETLGAGVHVDFDAEDGLVGIEVVEASRLLGPRLQVDLALATS